MKTLKAQLVRPPVAIGVCLEERALALSLCVHVCLRWGSAFSGSETALRVGFEMPVDPAFFGYAGMINL